MAVAAGQARTVSIYVATTRARKEPGQNLFTNERSLGLNYARFDISIPPGHKPANIEWPHGTPDPARHFVTVSSQAMSDAEFRAATARAAGRDRTARTFDAAVFVHGYNQSFQEALFRMAQMMADADVSGVPVLFAWPSEAAISGYAADRDAVLFSRDGLSRTLRLLAGTSGIRRIAVLGHSMGAALVAESVRQLRLTGDRATVAKLQVVLAAPDIDVDVFRSQLEVIGPLQPPMTVLVSPGDRALLISRIVSSERERIGSLDVSDPRVREAALKAHVDIVDISELPATDQFNHDRYVQLAALYSRLQDDRRRGRGTLGAVGAGILTGAGEIISSPFNLAGRALAN